LGLGMWVSTWRIDLLISFSVATRLRVGQSLGLGFLFVPVTLAAYVGLPAEKGGSVSGIINFMRNIGSSVGTSMVTTMLARREQFHQVRLASYTSPADPAFQNQVAGLSRQLVASGTSVADAPHVAHGLLYQALQTQSQTLAYIDTYMLLAVAAGIMFVLAFAISRNDPRASGSVAAG
jgi:MFS transporter, DHA2 family, multidrug resistance protein